MALILGRLMVLVLGVLVVAVCAYEGKKRRNVKKK